MPEKHKDERKLPVGYRTTTTTTKDGFGNSTSFFPKDHPFPSLTRKFLQLTFYLILPFIVFRLYFYPYPHETPVSIRISSASSSPSFPPQEEEPACDYTRGKWVPDKTGPLYNGTTCGTIKAGQNCMTHGRPDRGYLDWSWQPQRCHLPKFDPIDFLQLYSHRHIAFVGDSIARNQLESLLCMLSSVSPPQLIYTNGEDNKFRRWRFPSHNATLSVYWSPFLVKGVEKSPTGPDHNELYLDQIDHKWGKDLGSIDTVVFSIGHWFLHPAVYFEHDSVLGCHYCPGMNHTEIGFYDVLRKAVRTTLEKTVGIEGLEVVLVTFSPSHFQGEWDKFGACSKTEPYKEGEKVLEGMDGDMRRIEVEEVGQVVKMSGDVGRKVRVEALDVTELSLMRPDGHPGPYMHPFPFANGVSDRVQNDCVHWCLPGPVDTWNQILVQLVKRLRRKL